MDENKKWYVVYTRQGREKKVAEILSRKKFENYCPLNKVMRPWSDARKLVPEPLFASQVFVRVCESDFRHLTNIDGVINIVYWLGKPAVICDTEVETIKGFLKEYPTVKLEKVAINMDNNVTVSGNLLVETVDYIPRIADKTAKINLPSLGYTIVADASIPNNEIIFRNLSEVEAQAG
jgi:transcription antitermination factor NusG